MKATKQTIDDSYLHDLVAAGAHYAEVMKFFKPAEKKEEVVTIDEKPGESNENKH